MKRGTLAGIYLLYALTALVVLARFGLTITGIVIVTLMLLAIVGLHSRLTRDEPKRQQKHRAPAQHVHRGDLP